MVNDKQNVLKRFILLLFFVVGLFVIILSWRASLAYYPMTNSFLTGILSHKNFLSILLIVFGPTIGLALYLWVKNKSLLPVIITYFSGLILALLMGYFLEDAIKKQGYQKFIDDVENRIVSFSRQIRSDLQVLESLKAFYSSHERAIDRDEFHDYTRQILKNKESIKALKWVFRVPGDMQELYDADAPDGGHFNFHIFERGVESFEPVPILKRDFYYPIYYIEPLKGNEAAIGFDIGSDPVLKRAMDKAEKLGQMVASEPIELIPDQNNSHIGFIAFSPIFLKDTLHIPSLKNKDELKGFVLGVFRVDHMLEESLGYLAATGINFSMTDITDPNQRLLIYETDPEDLLSADKNSQQAFLRYDNVVNVAGRQYLIQGEARFEHTFGFLVWVSRMSSLAIFLFTIMIAYHQIVNIGRREAIEETVKQRTHDLLEAKKRLENEVRIRKEVQHELEKVNEELNNFVYTASHDLRSPLRNISSCALFIEEDSGKGLDQGSKEYLAQIKKISNRMIQLIDDLLTLSRVTRIRNPYEVTNVREVVDSVIEVLQTSIEKTKANISIETSLPSIYCDRIKLTQVLTNLLNNAIKFSSKNQSPKIKIGHKDEVDSIEFYIKDNGIGISPRNHNKVFDFFIRLHTDDEYEGTGAGLNIVKKIIEEHNGKIWIDSEIDKGAIFWFSLPKQSVGDPMNMGEKELRIESR